MLAKYVEGLFCCILLHSAAFCCMYASRSLNQPTRGALKTAAAFSTKTTELWGRGASHYECVAVVVGWM